MSSASRKAVILINLGWGIALACTLLRALVSTDPFPHWDSDPSRLDIPLSGLTPAHSQLIDLLIITGSGLAVIGETLAGGAVSWLFSTLVLLGAAGVWLHVPLRGGGTLDDARIGSTWIAAMAAGLAAMHVCRDERLRRITIAAGLGLVMMLAAKGIVQVTLEHAQTVRQYRSDPDGFAAAQGWLPGSGQVRAFERRLMQPEASGWFGLANVYASFAAESLVAYTGLSLLAWRASRERRLAAGWAPLLTLACLVTISSLLMAGSVRAFTAPWHGPLEFVRSLWSTGAKGGITVAAIGLALLAGRMLLVRRIAALGRLSPRAGGMLAIALVLSALAALVLRGVVGERMGELSLLFRWFYIQGASRIFAEHPLLGVGPAGFKDAYMLAKPPISPEEVQSPHSIFFDYASTLGLFGLAWGACFLGWAFNLGRQIVNRDDQPQPAADTRAESWLTALLIIAPMVRAAQLELAIGSRASALMRLSGLALWLAVSLATLALARTTNAWKWAAAIAALVLAVHGQIEVTPVWPGSCCLLIVLIAAAGASPAPVAHRRTGLITGTLLILIAIAWAALVSLPIARWERLLKQAAAEVRPIAEITTRLALTKDPTSGESLRQIAADLGAILDQPPPSDDATLTRALDMLMGQRSAAAADTLTRAASLAHWHFPTTEAATRMRLAHAAALVRLGRPAPRAFDDAAAIAQHTAPQKTASAYGLLANVWSTRADLERNPDLMDRAIEAWTKAAAMDPYGLTFPLRAFRAELARGHADAARRWAQRLLELDKLQRLDPLKGLTKAERDQVEGALRLP